MNELRVAVAKPRERLSGERPIGPDGAPIDPGDALPFDAHAAPPTMLDPRALSYLHWLASRTTGAGRVVELGCFLGGSTAALDAGLRAAPANGPFADSPLLVYDGFEAPQDAGHVNEWWMKPFGLQAAEDFLPRYRSLHAERLERLEVRKGWLPEFGDERVCAGLYPEREPIELLFVDAAKSWGVHVTILRAFARWMRPGAVLVQQDFMELLPWLSLHMWELRECFEPLDLVRGAPTLSFRCVADPTDAIDHLSCSPEQFDGWDGVAAYWERWLLGIGDAIVASHRVAHLVATGSFDHVHEHAERFQAWSTSAASVHVYRSPFWSAWLSRLPASEDCKRLQALHAARGMMPSKHKRVGDPIYEDAKRRSVATAIEALRHIGASTLALYGAGQHTRWLLSRGGPLADCMDDFEIVCVIDDAPSVNEVMGVPVLRPADALERVRAADAIVPSSDAHERTILKRIRDEFGTLDTPVLPIYTNMDLHKSDTAADDPMPSSLVPVRVRAEHLEAMASYRHVLGVPEKRDWLEAFAEVYAPPAWASGYVNYRDALLLWDLIEAIRPRVTVEVGVASGVSTCLLAHALAHFGGTHAGRIISVDLDERCYFDRSRAVGEATELLEASLRASIDLHPGSTAIDAALEVALGSVEFAFIDGDHRHPAPTLDLIALLFALRPGAWVALHDIELPTIAARSRAEFSGASGASMLFHAWPFERVQPTHEDPTLNNIGAIRMPERWQDRADVLIALLNEPWEIGGPSDRLAGLLRVPR